MKQRNHRDLRGVTSVSDLPITTISRCQKTAFLLTRTESCPNTSYKRVKGNFFNFTCDREETKSRRHATASRTHLLATRHAMLEKDHDIRTVFSEHIMEQNTALQPTPTRTSQHKRTISPSKKTTETLNTVGIHDTRPLTRETTSEERCVGFRRSNE